jgi:hypothetical protein
MATSKKLGCMLLVFLFGSAIGYAQSDPSLPIDVIIKKFSEKEKEFKLARANYVYRQEVRVEELNASDRVTGAWQETTDVGFDGAGKRTEKVIYAPANTLKNISMTVQDLQDLREIQPFVLTSDDIAKYNLKYVGKDAVDEIHCYKFDVEPKKIEKGQRYFQGSIWVDDRDFQIVKTYGKAVPDIRERGQENLFPRFETYREQIDDYWFPTYTRAVDTLNFSTGKQRIRQVVKYTNYKKFQTNVKLKFGDEVKDGDKAAPAAPAESTKAPALDPKYKNEPAPNKK